MNRRFRAIGFDLGDTLLAYRGVPLNWASLYDEALRAVAVRCGAVPTAEGLRLHAQFFPASTRG